MEIKSRTVKPHTKRKVGRKVLRGVKHIITPFFKGILVGAGVVALAVALTIAGYQYVYHLVNPDIKHFINTLPAQSTKLYTEDGTLLYEIFGELKRTYVPLTDISVHAQHATIAIEDKDFYSHKGLSVPSIVRSALMDYYVKDTVYGGSTITQQLVKNTILTNEKSIVRKVAEIIWAIELERRLSKEEILERYLNQIPYGRNAAGIEAASKSFFNKSAKDLDISESAYLAALPQAPSLYNPDGQGRELLDARKNYIIDQMLAQGFISSNEHDAAIAKTVTFAPNTDTIIAPHFVFWVKQELITQYGKEAVLSKGYKVYTTLDMRLQRLAEDAVKMYAEKNSKRYNAHNAALVAVDPKDGYVKAMVGSKDYFGTSEPTGCKVGKDCLFEPNANVATSLRQPGSSFKPYVYATAFGEDFKFTPATIVSDVSKNFSTPGAPAYIPHNYNGVQYGKVPVRKALAGSLNIAAVNTLSQIGTASVMTTIRSVGITAPMENCGLALALGSCEISLLEHVGGFATFANMGKHNDVTGIAKIEDGYGKTILQSPPQNKPAINPQAAYELIDIMTDNNARTFIFGSKTPLVLKDRKVAAKTGTTQNWKDGWTVGFTPSLAVGVWAGNNDGTLMYPGSDGVFVAAPLWNSFMTEALKDTPPEEFAEPNGIVRAAINPRTGKVMKATSSKQKLEVLAGYAVPIDEIKLPVIATPQVKKPIIPGVNVDGTQEATVIVGPLQNEVITQTPFDVKVYTGSSTEETEVELFIDGQKIATKKSPPFLFTIASPLKNTWHTITAKATHFGLLESSYTIKVKTFFNPPAVNPRGTTEEPTTKP